MNPRQFYPRLLYCYLFVLVVGFPLQFGLRGWEGASFFLWDVGLFDFGIFLLQAWKFNRKNVLSIEEARSDLVFNTCSPLCTALPFAPPRTASWLAFGIYTASTTGRIDPDAAFGFGRRFIFINMMVALTAGIFASIHLHENTTIAEFSYNTLAPVAASLVGQLIGIVLNRCIPPLVYVWDELKALARIFGGYALGYILISITFAGFFASLYKVDSASLHGLGPDFTFADYWYYSVAVMTTTIDAEPATHIAKLVVALDVLVGIAWTVVVFAAVLNAADKVRVKAVNIEVNPWSETRS